MRRGPGRPRKILTGRRGRPKLAYNYTPNSVQSNFEAAAIDNVRECMNSSTDEETFHEANSQFVQANPSEVDPRHALQGSNSKEWQEAIYEEMKSLINNDTWKIVKRQVNRNIIGCRMVLTNKFSSDGTLARRKVRLVAKEYSQKPGTNFKKTFAPVARLSSMRLMTALAAKHNLKLYQLDIKTAFLNGDIEEEILKGEA